MVPQISVILGPCAGGAVYSPAMTDFIFMVRESSHMFITGPDVVKTVTGEDVTLEELGGAMSHASKSGVATFVAADEKACLDDVRYLLSFLPANNMEEPPVDDTGDDPERLCPELRDLLPASPNLPYDMHKVINAVVDDGEFFEYFPHWAKSILCGFARIDGHTVGVVANQPMVLAGVLDIESSEKAARFVRTCDAFNIPLITFVDVPGFLPGVDQEYGGIIRHGAKLLYAYCESTVPRIQIITRKAYGGAYVVMNSKSIGADLAFAWPSAELAVMGPQGAVEIVYRRELQQAADPGRATGRARRRVQREVRESLRRRRARLHRRRDRSGRHPSEGRRRPRHAALEARGVAPPQARQRPDSGRIRTAREPPTGVTTCTGNGQPSRQVSAGDAVFQQDELVAVLGGQALGVRVCDPAAVGCGAAAPLPPSLTRGEEGRPGTLPDRRRRRVESLVVDHRRHIDVDVRFVVRFAIGPVAAVTSVRVVEPLHRRCPLIADDYGRGRTSAETSGRNPSQCGSPHPSPYAYPY